MVAWRKGRSELFNKARNTFIEVEIAKELAEVQAEYNREQKKIRDELYNKVIRIGREKIYIYCEQPCYLKLKFNI